MSNTRNEGMWVNKSTRTDADATITRQTCCVCHTPVEFVNNELSRDDYCPACGAHMTDISPVDDITAYFRNKPIRNPDDMPSQLLTDSIDAEWDARIQEEWWHHTHTTDDALLTHHPNSMTVKLLRLRDRLLSFGGSEVCMPMYDFDVDTIMSRGQLWYGDRIHMIEGEPSQCHRNSAGIWNVNRANTVLSTGYALSQDGMWRQHSWLIELRPRKNRIVETTAPRIAYFGFAMTDDEAQQFYDNIG